MSAKSGLRAAIGAVIGVQAIAFAAFAQTPETRPQDSTGARTPSQTTTAEERAQTTRSTSPQDPARTTSDPARTTSDPARTTSGDATHKDMEHDKDHAKAMKPVTPQSFATQAAVIGKAEIELAQLALNNTKNEEIRLYAEKMVKDHTAADQKLKQIAAAQKLQLPQTLDAKHQALKQKLSSLQGDAFDREYKKHMEAGHEDAVALFESASQQQQMPKELKEFAASTLPTLERHHELAKKLDAKEGA